MSAIVEFLSPEKLVESGGLLLIGAIVFAESGLLIGFFLPGDSLLFAAGFFAANGDLNIAALLAVVVAAAIIGDNVGYSIGKKTGHKIFKKDSGKLFHKDHLIRSQKFYEKHGGKTIILARFVPIVRTFAPMAAGIAKMPRQKFLAYNVIGALIWGIGVTMVGFWAQRVLGEFIDIDKYILPIVGLAVFGTFGVTALHVLKDKETRKELFGRLTSFRNVDS